ncbi:MAG: nuclear transport factor 2 family protein [Burkholderiaceae bacterium]|nr:nuclear transport factor 2 family protein [Burkholderiaceae bacterium]
MLLSTQDQRELTQLEHAMWQESTRFDVVFQEARFAADFMEFGRSGRTYTRSQIIRTDRSPINATLTNFQVHAVDVSTALVTYDSDAVYNGDVEHAHRSSIWTRGDNGWQMRFHQGTPFKPDASGTVRSAA